MKKFLIFSASALFLASAGYFAAYWLVIATSRLTGAKIASLSLSEFFTYRIAVALMFLFCGVCACIIARMDAARKKNAPGIFSFFITLATVIAAAAAFIVIRFFMLNASASAAEGEQAYLFLSSLNYASWGSAGAICACAVSGIRYAVVNRRNE